MSIYPSKYPQGYYVYAYIRDKSSTNGVAGTPYYIGKGSGKRAWHSPSHCIKPPQEFWRIIILACNLSEVGSLALERRMIRFWGRLDIGTGCLHNKTDGGEGTSGYRHSDVAKKSIGVKNTGRACMPETRSKIGAALKGVPKSESHSTNISKAMKGKKFSQTHIDNLKKARAELAARKALSKMGDQN